MLYLLAVVLLNTLISVAFKLFPKYGVNALQAIVVNYWICVITGSLCLGHIPVDRASIHADWLPWALLMGGAFISIFNLLAYCTKMDGITTATIANKLSLVIPVLFSIILYNDTLNTMKLMGILLAFPAVYLTARVKDDRMQAHNLFWPALLFISSGLLDTLVKYVEQNYLPSPGIQATFTIHAFAIAGTIGIVLVLMQALSGKTMFSWKSMIAGICIGIPNYFSIYLLIRMLHSHFLQSSAAIPINNIGIVVVSTVTAIVFFREKVTLSRAIGLILAILAILLIAFNGRSI